ncbi:MAG: Rne/Rng family ribonuclease [Bacteroidales bacterium]|nr:Rne/Rng family ribonuclease [Bacteroidales bacterium]
MTRELFVEVDSNEIKIALLEDKTLVELNKEKNNLQFSVGDIYLGRVKKIMPGLNAAFVDVGYSKDAFLHYLDLGPNFLSLQKYMLQCIQNPNPNTSLNVFDPSPEISKNGKINQILKSGQVIVVQIAKEPISTKGPRLTSEISIAGRNLVLVPFSNKVSVSQKIKSSEERQRLKHIVESILPSNYGVIIRTVSEGKHAQELNLELRELIDKWENAFKKIYQLKPPMLILGELERTNAILRDLLNESFANIYVNDKQIANTMRSFIQTIEPEKEKIIKYHQSNTSLFEQFGINKQIKSLFGKTVTLKSGIYLIIEHTEALHVIDVNSGHRQINDNNQEQNALEVNLIAAEEIARQLRLRDMGGIIVIDFIDMYKAENKKMLYERMKKLMEKDRAKHNILPLSKFGLMQITRQRVRPELNIITVETCPTCSGTGQMGSSILISNQIESYLEYLFEKTPYRYFHIKANPYVAAYLKSGWLSLRLKWMLKYKRYIKITAENQLSFLEYHIFNRQGFEIEL